MLSTLPPELVLHHVLPPLRVRDALSLGATNKYFASLCEDEGYWKHRCQEDYNFSGSGTARSTGWKPIYKGLAIPSCYVWGSSEQGRLGLKQLPRILTRGGGVPNPTNLCFPSKTIVHLDAGGWSFSALDHKGQLQVCGILDAEEWGWIVRQGNFSSPRKMAQTPIQLQMPTPLRSISCGRKHLMALDSTGDVWTFNSWGRPYRLISPVLDRSCEATTAVQVESGWMFCSVLTGSGDVYVWWPFMNPTRSCFLEHMKKVVKEGDKFAEVSDDGVVTCATWDLSYNPFRLPNLPILPELSCIEGEYDSHSKPELIKLAAMDNYLVGLTNKGHVLKFGDLNNETSAASGRWEYLPHFSDINVVGTHSAFSRGGKNELHRLSPPSSLKITHISGHLDHFVAYSTGVESIVLIGKNDISPQTPANILPELQYKSVISVVLGDYHFAALTADGKLYTWGSYSDGALGLGNIGLREGRVTSPTQVKFDKGPESFCFAVAASGHHTGALLLNI